MKCIIIFIAYKSLSNILLYLQYISQFEIYYYFYK